VIEVRDAAARVIREHAATEYPRECCGAIVGRAQGASRFVTAAWPLANTSGEDHERRFTIDPSTYRSVELRAEYEGVSLLGFYHSHPDAPARPSQTDLMQALPNIDYIIVSVVHATPSDVTCWRLRDDRAAFAPEEIQWRPES
jgi:proteasome lid subunit RPN8/RPN11